MNTSLVILASVCYGYPLPIFNDAKGVRMGTRQRKVERQRLKRKQKKRQLRVLSLRGERHLKSDAHPLHACVVNRHWHEDGMASILMTRHLANGRLTLAAFLVDRWAMGLKDAWGRTDISVSEFDEYVARMGEHLDTCSLDLATARHLVYGGIDLARRLGFRLPRRYERWTAILGPLPEGETPDMSLFLDNGKIRLICSQRDLEARLIGTTPEKFLARPDVGYILGDDGLTLVDEEEDKSADLVSQLEQAMLLRAQQWCFANGQTPHPLLPEVVGAAMEAMTQSVSPDQDPDEDIAALSDEQRDEMVRQVRSFLSASLHHDHAALHAAMAQFDGFMTSFESPQELFDGLDLEQG